MKNILITNPSMVIGGVETSLINFLKHLDFSKYQVDLLLKDKGLLEQYIPNEVNIIYYSDFVMKPCKFLYGIKKDILVESLYNKYKYVFKKEYDISIAFNGFDNYLDMIAASVKSNKKLIWVHNDFKNSLKNKKHKYWFNKCWQKMSQKFEFFDEIICVSNNAKKNFDSMFPKYKNKTRVLYNIPDEKYIKKLSQEKTNIKLNGRYNMVYLGRLVKDKQINQVINIHKKLINKNYNIKTYIIGDGPEYNNILKQTNTNHLTNSVIMLGYQLNPYNILKQANLLISCSKYESFGNTLLESAILNIPFISTPNSGSKEIVESILNKGIICDIDEMPKEIEKLIKRQETINYNYIEHQKKTKKEIEKLLE